MGKLIYMLNVSLDGFVETPDKGLEWATVDEEVHQWFNDRTRELSASLYGRGMYETMAPYWPNALRDPATPPVEREFAELWNAMPKFVFSQSLESVDYNSRLVRGDITEELARLRQEFDGDLDVGGATLAASFIERDLVDEFHLVVHPVAIGAGTPFFPALKSQIPMRLKESRVFPSGVTYLGYERAP